MSEKLRDSTDLFHDTDIHLPTKTMLMSGDVDKDMYDKATRNLHILDLMCKDSKPITIKLNSGGGEVVYGLAIYDLIRSCTNTVRIVVEGSCESMASIILQAGDERVITANSCLMLHFGTQAISEDHVYNVNRWKKKQDRDEAICQDIYLKRIKEKKKRFTKKDLENLLLFDTILSATQAIEYGLIDSIKE